MKISAKTSAAILWLASAVAPTTPSLADDAWSVTGYAKSYAVYQNAPDIELDGTPLYEDIWQSQNALRLMLAGDVTENIALELHYEIKPVFYSKAWEGGTSGGALTTLGASSYRIGDLNAALQDDEKIQILQNLDRANLQVSFDPGDLTIGRQTISFGAARFVSPTDIFRPFAPATLDQEYRPGVDAVRWQGTLGGLTEYDLGLVANNEGPGEELVGYARIKTSLSGNDLEAVVIARDGITTLGAGWERALGSFGFWAEAAYTASEATNESVFFLPTLGTELEENYFRFSTGLDRALSDNVLAMIEYHHSSFGTDDLQRYQYLPLTGGFQSGGVYLVGKDYLIPSISWTATPLLNLSASAFVNLTDTSAFVRASGDYSLTENLYTDFGVHFGLGDATRHETIIISPPFSPPFPYPQLVQGSEFGSFPTTAYISLRYYF